MYTYLYVSLTYYPLCSDALYTCVETNHQISLFMIFMKACRADDHYAVPLKNVLNLLERTN